VGCREVRLGEDQRETRRRVSNCLVEKGNAPRKKKSRRSLDDEKQAVNKAIGPHWDGGGGKNKRGG